MNAGTSTVSTATWQHSQFTSFQTPEIAYAAVQTTLPPNFQNIQPRETSGACCPNEVVVHLSTIVVIPDYHAFYQDPIQSFKPTYNPLPDGSLITPPISKMPSMPT
ncbi:hypothetical protein BD779DRAFT_1666411 [Infundibulicybe gibba]|nr:hypothetical protein BD779DRAFT_1666411 [Infundibulicybe gibba]